MNKDAKSEWDLSFCGLNCAACEIYLAQGDKELHDRLLKFFQENFDSSITTVSCERCRGTVDKCWTSDCHFRTCATEQGLTYCFECNDFVCEKLAEFGKHAPPHQTNIIENLKKMKEMGVEEWIASQREFKFCP